MESKFENKIIELVDLDSLSIKELVFITLILKGKPNQSIKNN